MHLLKAKVSGWALTAQFVFCLLSASTVTGSQDGLVVDLDSCAAYINTIDMALATARQYVDGAIRATTSPGRDPYYYFFQTSMNQTVDEVFKRMRDALNGTGPTIPLKCERSYAPEGWSCDGPDAPTAWAAPHDATPFINFCPWALEYFPASPNPCKLPDDPFEINRREHWPNINNIWLEKICIADLFVHELSHIHSIRGNDFGTVDPDAQPQFFRVYGAHTLAHAEDVELRIGDRLINATDIPTSWEYMAKEAWRDELKLRQRYNPSLMRHCIEDHRTIYGGHVDRDELRRLRRLRYSIP